MCFGIYVLQVCSYGNERGGWGKFFQEYQFFCMQKYVSSQNSVSNAYALWFRFDSIINSKTLRLVEKITLPSSPRVITNICVILSTNDSLVPREIIFLDFQVEYSYNVAVNSTKRNLQGYFCAKNFRPTETM